MLTLERPLLRSGAAAPLRHQNRALTAIRGIAALWVVGHHLQFGLGWLGYHYAGAIFGPGYVAVDIFFVLSGFVITAVHRDLTPGGLGDFLIRRLFRIYPLHLFVLALILALWIWTEAAHGGHDPTERLRDLPIAALLLQPYLIHGLTWNPVSWSIGVEMLCYLLFPLALRHLRRLSLPGCLMLLIAAALFERHVHSEVIWGWPAILRGLAGFALGMLLQQASVLLPAPRARTADLLGLAAASGMILSVVSGAIADVPLFAGLLILVLAAETGRLSKALGAGPLHWLGQISFSLYLLHPTLASLAYLWLPPASLHLGPGLTALTWSAIMLACLLVLATLTWRFIEEPARRHGTRLARGWA